jgi:N-acetylglucosamine-6-sulfatase
MKAIAALLAIVSLSIAGAPAKAHELSRAATGEQPPSIVFILTDDQRWDSMEMDGHRVMPIVDQVLGSQGMTLERYFLSIGLCCPSRTSIMRGQYATHTGVYSNEGYFGGFSAFQRNKDDLSNIATWLHGAGYRTGMIGKFLNGYGNRLAPIVPPGWDTWNALTDTDYFDFAESVNGVLTKFPSPIYQTDKLGEQAIDFITTTPEQTPLFLWWAPHAPHGPATPAPEDEDAEACSWLLPFRPPSFDEPDVSDKPLPMRLPPMSHATMKRNDAFRVNQCRSLQSVDRWVGKIVSAMATRPNTLFVYASDNGMMYGEHRMAMHKDVAYEEAIRSPFIARWDGVIPPGAVDDQHLAVNIDLAQTFAEAARVTPPYATDGVSLLPILTASNPQSWRSAFLLEHGGGGETAPAFCGTRTDETFAGDLVPGASFTYVWYFGSEEDPTNEELYNLSDDPYQLENLALSTDPSVGAVLARLRDWVATACDPLPPEGSRPANDAS